MTEIVKQSMSDVWASAGDIVAPDSAKIASGWAVEVVPRQYWNWMQNRTDVNLAYMFQHGIPEWDATVEYIINKSYVQYNDVVYKAILTGTNQNPSTATTYWKIAFATSTTALELLKTVSPSTDKLPYFSSATTATTTTLSGFARSILDDTSASAVRTTIAAQAQDATLQALSDLATDVNKLPYFTGVSTVATTDLSAFARTLLDDTSAVIMQATLGLGSMATQSASGVAITGGSITGITDLAIADGGTGASTASGALTNLGAAPIANPTFTGIVNLPQNVLLGAATGGALEIGGTSGTATNAFIDFHSGATPTDYDARIICPIGTGTGTAAQGTIQVIAGNINLQPSTGTVTVPTAAVDTNTTQAASTAFVIGQAATVAPVVNGTAAVGTDTKFARQDHVHPTDTTRAPIASPTFTGVPSGPTATLGVGTTQLATTDYVMQQNTRLTKSIAGGVDVTLTATEAGYYYIVLTGAITANINVNIPVTFKREYRVIDSTTGAFTVTVKTPSGTGVTLKRGYRFALYNDGTNIIDAITASWNISDANIAYGITPYSWGSSYYSLDFGQTASLFATSTNFAGICTNLYYNGTNWTYKANGTAANLGILGNTFNITVAATGTAGATATLVSTLGVDANGDVIQANPAGRIGYGTGAGGTVTQATSKATTVVLNKPSGRITMNAAALAAGASVSFQLTNSVINATDIILLQPAGFTDYRVESNWVGVGGCGIRVTNVSGGSLSEALLINFAVIKGVIA